MRVRVRVGVRVGVRVRRVGLEDLAEESINGEVDRAARLEVSGRGRVELGLVL